MALALGSFLLLTKLILVLSLTAVSAEYDYYYDQKPLILTPYLKKGDIALAQKLATTKVGGRTSYTGYYTTNEACGNNLFAWFIPAKKGWESAPVLLWLNGGPGSTSMFGLFVEIGPWNHLHSKGFVDNPYSWTIDHNVIFLDQPVGTGFSFTEKDCYARNLTAVNEDIYSALSQFFQMFPQLQKNMFLLTGESFSGHYIPALAVKIDSENKKSGRKMNLVGILVGNPYIDARCVDPSTLMYELGIIDAKVRDRVREIQAQLIEAVNQKDYAKFRELYSLVLPRTYLPSYYNVLYDEAYPHSFFDYVLFLKEIKNRDLFHVGYTPFFDENDVVFDFLFDELANSQGPSVEYLLNTNKYIVGFYTGQLDSVVPVTSVSCVLSSLKWPGLADYLNATRSPWYNSGRLAGWIKVSGNVLEAVVRAAGHFVPKDQGAAALDLIKSVVAKKPGPSQNN